MNDQIIPLSSCFRVTKVGDNQFRLSVDIARPEHAGRYKCVAENPSGKATSEIDVVVRPRQQPDDSFINRRAVFTQSSTTVSTVQRQVNTGQAVQIKTEEVTVMMEKKESDEMPVLSVKQRASLFAGPSDSSAPVVQSPKIKFQRSKEVAPRFVTPLTGAMIEPGAFIQLEGVLDGYPMPDIKWYKNGVEIIPPEEPDRLDITSGGQKVRLSIKDMEESDAGRYTCTARNSAGTASSTADIVVRRTQFP